MNLEIERKKLDLKKVEMAKHEMEFKILERLADIERLKENVANQEKAIEKIKQELISMEG